MKKVTMKDVAKEPAVSALFTGDVSRQNVLDPNDSSNFNFGIVSFSAGSRNKFHKHSGDQILIITEGTGTVATDDESLTVHQGDVVVIPAGENHWDECGTFDFLDSLFICPIFTIFCVG